MTPYMTTQQIDELRTQRRMFYIHPRNRQIIVDGFKVYSLTQSTLDELKKQGKGKIQRRP